MRERLKPLYDEYRQKKYRIVLFESGTCDLTMLTGELLKHNAEVMARKEPQQELC
ncbi:MAG: hypothetical protein IJW76_01420 [Clostridia bacterium]|nr:hypothetical protein [Clostridia bacterium]